MDAAMMDRKTQKRSSGPSQPAAHSRSPVYHTATAPSRSVSSKRHPSHSSDRPQHPSLSRVKGRANMYTPPRTTAELSWLRDQSPSKDATKTPPRACKTPDQGTPTQVNPASALLQDLLKEQRAHRSSRGPVPESWDDNGPRTPDAPRVQEETASEKARKVNDVFSAGLRQPKEMAMREMDQYVSKINKLNFDLKLEIFHRTQQMSALEKKLVRMQEMEEELERMHRLEDEVDELRAAERKNQGLQESNTQLHRELDKRDQAVTEAVELICQLEGKIEQLETGGRTSQMSIKPETVDGSNVATPKALSAIDIPERTSSKRDQSLKAQSARQRSSELRRLAKGPSFLRANNHSTATLRSLYSPEMNQSRTALTELTKSESFNTMSEVLEPESPRLSVLSECSELHPYENSTRWNSFDKLEIPVRKAPSTTGSLDSYVPPAEQEESKGDQIDKWMQPRPDMSETVIMRRRNRAHSDASQTGAPDLIHDLYSGKPRGRPRLDASLFGGARLPPTPDTMSTAHVAATNGSNGSIAARRSPPPDQDPWFPGRRLDRRRSADELTTRRSFNGSEITDSMQTNCSDTPRLGTTTAESPTIYPFNTVASKASELLGPGSPNNPVIDSFDVFHDAQEEVDSSSVNRSHSPRKAMTPEPRSMGYDSSPPLTPQDWLAAAKQGPRSRKERAPTTQKEELPMAEPPRVLSQAAFHDDRSIDSYPTAEAEVPGIPTLDMADLDLLEQPPVGPIATSKLEPEPEPEPEPRRRLSFRPPFFGRSSNASRRLQSSPMISEFPDDDEDGAPSPIIPKTRNIGGASRRPTSQIIADSPDLYSSSLPPACDGFGGNFGTGLPPSFRTSVMAAHSGSTTISARPSTSHSADHKRRSSLGIFSWVKGVSGKLSDSPGATTAKEPRTSSRLAFEDGFGIARASTPESMDVPVVRPHSEMTVRNEDHARVPRYMGRRARRA
ncbi:hypothetical protein NUU61_007988 [Penicillium alfredii]|uniref:Centrosomin N-terminal motif 1 domain-containing protein n=1 Tax=Penicillium alfredii TaxID=1506179 RepID=A0A9W9ERS5_9EURO|nr:uncharacterized protein NUU61_007988 [Penicillium alfredii]KAJ5086681.1 hypothetical protein NUU61_007988 [Penicillium alfredii]